MNREREVNRHITINQDAFCQPKSYGQQEFWHIGQLGFFECTWVLWLIGILRSTEILLFTDMIFVNRSYDQPKCSCKPGTFSEVDWDFGIDRDMLSTRILWLNELFAPTELLSATDLFYPPAFFVYRDFSRKLEPFSRPVFYRSWFLDDLIFYRSSRAFFVDMESIGSLGFSGEPGIFSQPGTYSSTKVLGQSGPGLLTNTMLGFFYNVSSITKDSLWNRENRTSYGKKKIKTMLFVTLLLQRNCFKTEEWQISQKLWEQSLSVRYSFSYLRSHSFATHSWSSFQN